LPASCGVIDAQTDPLPDGRDAQIRLPEQSASPVHGSLVDCVPTTTRLHVAATDDKVDAEMDVVPLPYAALSALTQATPSL
jgi:hypothetical protein